MYCVKFFKMLSLLVLLSSCSVSDAPAQEKNKGGGQQMTEAPGTLINEALERDARGGVTYRGQFYWVLTNEQTPLFNADGTPTGKNAARGTVFSKIIGDKEQHAEGYMPVTLDGGKTWMPTRSACFAQEVEGMRYPLYGIVQSDEESAVYYNKEEQKEVKIPLKKGTVYLYELTKDDSYINVWDEYSKTFVTARYCCKVHIVQADDHAKILRDFKTKMQHILY